MTSALSSHPAIWIAIAIVVGLVWGAGRLPVFGALLRLSLTLVLAGALVLALMQRERFDPWLGGIGTRLGLSDQRVDGKEVRVRMSPDGHFWVRASIDGHEQRLLVDSGATVTALSQHAAERAGLDLADAPIPMVLQTANGPVRPQTATVHELTFGTVVARDLPVVVSPAFGDMNVLEMNFLSRLKSWRVEDGWLILTPHHPQDQKSGG